MTSLLELVLWKSNFIFGMPKLFELDPKQLLTTEFHILNHVSKRFGIPKMKSNFQNIGWKLKTSNTEFQKPSADAKIYNMEIQLTPETPQQTPATKVRPHYL